MARSTSAHVTIPTLWLVLGSACLLPDASVADRDAGSTSKPGPSTTTAVSKPPCGDGRGDDVGACDPRQMVGAASDTVSGLDDAGSDAVPLTRCGDGHVTDNELCDTAIPDGQPRACPRSCPTEEDCVPRVLTGSGCRVECVVAQGELSCIGGDLCCPLPCTHANDSDCSAGCGNGVVEEANGETCEPGSSKPCMSDVAECNDGNPCTVDSLTGTPGRCNVKCGHRPITETRAGDSCCPTGASSLNDSDCKPRCGNHVLEAGEACDGEAGCDGTCMLHNNDAEVKCLAIAKTECDRCACMHCTATELACRANADPKANAACDSLLTCSVEQKCSDNTQCYCGPLACLTSVLGAGPCKDVIDTVAQAFGNRSAIEQGADSPPTTPVGFAAAADNCRVQQCRGVCR